MDSTGRFFQEEPRSLLRGSAFLQSFPLRMRRVAVVAASLLAAACLASPDWSQHGFDAQRTSWNPASISHPWRWAWAWNGPDARGRVAKVTASGSLPRNVQPVTGAGRVYVAAGSNGVYALRASDGRQLWNARIGDVRSTVAFDEATGSVFALTTQGRLIQLRASDGKVRKRLATGKRSDLPLPPALAGDRVYFAMGDSVFAVDKRTMNVAWTHRAGATVAVPPAISSSRGLVIVATEPDLNVRALRSADGSVAWVRRPVPASMRFEDPTEYRFGWPVVADRAGVVLVKVRLPWDRLWVDWPQTNVAIRAFLLRNPTHQALFALRLSDGGPAFVCNVGHGGFGDSDYLPMGFQPVVRTLPDGRQVAYVMARAKHAYDSRWDSHFAEMVLDDATVPGCRAGDVRFIAFDWPPGEANPFLLTDEQPNLAMAGDVLFGGHWEAGFALRLTDRSANLGGFDAKMPSSRLSSIVTSQDDPGGGPFSPSHYLPAGLYGGRPYDFGFYIYHGQGPVYDRYWSEYATWVVGGPNIYFRSCDGAIVALTPGTPSGRAASGSAGTSVPRSPAGVEPEVWVPWSEVRRLDGRRAAVSGVVQCVLNNGKHVLIGFARPHRGAFKAIVLKEHWKAFPDTPDRLYQPGQAVTVHGVVRWYQGDPAIFVASPEQIEALGPVAEIGRPVRAR